MIFNFQWKILRRHCFNNNSKFLKEDKLTGTGMAVFEKQRYSNPNSFFLQKKKKERNSFKLVHIKKKSLQGCHRHFMNRQYQNNKCSWVLHDLEMESQKPRLFPLSFSPP